MRLILILPIALITAAKAPSQTPGHAGGHAHSTPAAGTNDLRADAAFDSEGRLWMVRTRYGFLEVRRSDDLGRSWEDPIHVTAQPEPVDPGGDARPKVLPAPGGRLFVSWTRPLAKPYTGEIRLARSLDGGRSFEPPITVHRDRAEITHRFDAMALDRAGRLFVAWIDRRDALAAAAAAKPYRGAALYFAVSDDGGATFRGDFKAADHTCECCRVALVPAAGRGVLALWRHIFEPNVRDHAIANLREDGTADQLRRVTADDWRVDACPHHGPSLVEDERGRRHAVWFTATAAGGRAAYGRLGPGPGPEAKRLLGGKLAAHADLAVAGNMIVTAWKEFSSGHNLLKLAVSEDDGVTWRDTVLDETEGGCSQPRVLIRGGTFFVFWNTGTGPSLHAIPGAGSPNAAKPANLPP